VRENRGISWGLDHGIQHALGLGCEYLLLMNNDIEVDPGMLGELVAAAEADPRAGCAGPKSYYFAERRRLWSTGGILRWRGDSVTRERGDGELDAGQYDRDEEVDYVNGCAMLVRRQAIEAAGFWDPIYFLSVEDGDFCMRVKRQGFRCFYAHRAKLWHMVSQSTGGYKPGKTFQTGRSSAIFVRRYANPWQWFTALLFIAAALPAAFVRELPRGNTAAVIAKAKGFWTGFRVPMTPPPTVAGLSTLERVDRRLISPIRRRQTRLFILGK
jgi:GT2 family glycosyltransferase